MEISALIVGIDGWEQYTYPLMVSLLQHEPETHLVCLDNGSEEPYPNLPEVHRTKRLCYSAAINRAHRLAPPSDWYIVLSNDVLCVGPFRHLLEALGDVVAGPHLASNMGWRYLEGWCVCISADVWDALGGWDERYIMSSWEDVDLSLSARALGYSLAHLPALPFLHLDQKQRFGLPGYSGSEAHNYGYFLSKHAQREMVRQ